MPDIGMTPSRGATPETPDAGRLDENFGTSRAETPNYDDRGTTQTPRGNNRTYNRVMRRNVRRG